MIPVPVLAAWKAIPIEECGEGLVPIASQFIPESEHPYVAMGAPYPEGFSPYMLRETVAGALRDAQDYLLDECMQAGLPPYYIKVWDALRPISVQKFLAERDARHRAHKYNLDPDVLSERDMAFLIKEGRLFAAPSLDPAEPPPHSTGGTLDPYLVDAEGRLVDMGAKLDSGSRLAMMDAFNNARTPQRQLYDLRRMAFKRAMFRAGFLHNYYEWYHFDHERTQRGAYMKRLSGIDPQAIATYGRADGPFPASPCRP